MPIILLVLVSREMPIQISLPREPSGASKLKPSRTQILTMTRVLQGHARGLSLPQQKAGLAGGPERTAQEEDCSSRRNKPRQAHNGLMEEILEPELLICDPHHHLWDRPDSRYMTEELIADTSSGHRVAQTVFIECRSGYRTDGPPGFRPVGETNFVVAAEPGDLIAGIVGFADLRIPEIDQVLAAHVEAGNGRFRGIRHSNAWDASPDVSPTGRAPAGLLGDVAFRSGFTALGRAGLSFDAWMYHPQIIELVDLARTHPEVPIVLDHLGAPIGIGPYSGRRDEVLQAWRSAMQGLATCPNVVVKLGGIGMPVFGMDWHTRPDGASSEELAATWGGEIRWCIEQFGVGRCMFESNFPVDRASCSYPVLWNAFKRIVADASPAEKAALFHDTATSFYRL
jgi:predicted TIM-barrel fold metal-dependent hydrolase